MTGRDLRPLGERQLGNVYEMRIYTYQAAFMPEVLRRWGESIRYREKYSPPGGLLVHRSGGLNKFIHVWPYKDLSERHRIREEARKDPHWPPETREFIVRQENKLLIPAAFSPMM